MIGRSNSETADPRDTQTHYSGGHDHPEDVSDPTSYEDESQESTLEIISSYKTLLVGGIILLVFLILWLFYLERNLTASFLTNRYVHYAAAAALLFGVGTYHGRSYIRDLLDRTDWLVLASSSHVGLYLGEYKPAGEKVPPRFEPQKGFTTFGYSAEPYTIADIDPELARMQQKANRDAGEAAHIRLHPGMTTAKSTWFGTVVFQLSDGLEVDPFSVHSSLHATVPEIADQDTLQDLEQELRDKQDEVAFLEKRLQAVASHRNQLADELRDTRNEHIDTFTDQVGDLSEIIAGSRNRQQDGQQRPAPTPSRPSDNLPEADQ